jgi:predicted nucleic acid-binding protein
VSVLVDTSVWIRFLANQEPYASQLDALLGREEAVGHPFVFGELLVGDTGGRKELLSSYELLTHAHTVPHAEVVEFAHSRKLQGRGAGWIDIHLLAASLTGNYRLWTADKRCALLAQELGVAYEPGDW